MSGKFLTLISIVLALAVLCAWAPWIRQDAAEARAVEAFDRGWAFVADGCGTNCKGCGAISSRRVLFGVLVTIEYACGLIPADSPEYHQQSDVFISAFGTVHGLPKP